ncbi:MAG TPA: hypothetical protein VJ874_03295 [Candidatus Thermoplasmatota archaeon]|nr:hypothetical protein [Candidatus Thermoplasmatota archaeon]
MAVLFLALATPAEASPTRLAVLEVELQGGTAFLEWRLAPEGVGPAPSIDAWIVTKWTDDGQSTEILLPGSASSYTDVDVEAGRLYVYTVTYEEQGVRAFPSNPVFFSTGCFLILKCFPLNFDLPFPWVDEDCLAICI